MGRGCSSLLVRFKIVVASNRSSRGWDSPATRLGSIRQALVCPSATWSMKKVAQWQKVNIGHWISVGRSAQDAYVMATHEDGSLAVGYYQNRAKAIKEDVIWDGSRWEFRYPGPNGSYLSGVEEALVKRGPIR